MPFPIHVSQPIGAGGSGGVADEWVYLHPLLARGRSLCAAYVTGDCMELLISRGDIVLADVDAVPRDGDVVAVWLDGQLLAKRLYRPNGTVELRPNHGPSIVVPADQVQVQGVVFHVSKPIPRGGGTD